MRLVLGISARVVAFYAVCLLAASGSAAAQSQASRYGGIILSVAPVPTVKDRSPGTSQVTWSTGDGSPGVVTVSAEGGSEELFASGPSGTVPASWIAIGHTYIFRLYSTISGRRLLARLKVGQPAALEVIALPQKPKITPAVVDRLLQLLSFGSALLLALLAVMYVREVRRHG